MTDIPAAPLQRTSQPSVRRFQGGLSISGDASVGSALDMMSKAHVTSLIVEPEVQGDAYGIVTRQDLVEGTFTSGTKRSDASHKTVRQVMTKSFLTTLTGLRKH